MDGIILAGGFAKRMWPLTKNKPKQLLNLAGRPMLDYVIDSLINLDLDRIIVSVNSFFAPQFQDYLDSNTGFKNVELFEYGMASTVRHVRLPDMRPKKKGSHKIRSIDLRIAKM